MAKKNEGIKLRVNSARIIMIFAILFVVMTLIFYITFQHDAFWPLETSFFIYTPILFVTSCFFCVLSITSTYYVIDNKKLVHTKMGQTKEYYWKEILYIDEEWSLKHKMLHFYMADGKERFLAFDKEGLIYEYAINNGRLLSFEEFRSRFPNAKL